jgi:hypothetical protein
MTFTVDGWYSGATRHDAHPGRVGPPIKPWAIVVHTSDTPSEAWSGVLNRDQTQPGAHDGAHFWIGRDASEGVVQSVSIYRNAEHAGGLHAGHFVDAAGNEYHPNNVAVGIEMNCAGGVQKIGGVWHFVEGGKPSGLPIPDFEVTPDPQRPGRGWHRVTDYQYQVLGEIIDALEAVLAKPPAGAASRSPSQTPSAWAAGNGTTVGHCSLDFLDRSDPWPSTMQWLRDRHRSVVSG